MRVLNLSKIYYLIGIKNLQLLGSYSQLAVEIKHELTEWLLGAEPSVRKSCSASINNISINMSRPRQVDATGRTQTNPEDASIVTGSPCRMKLYDRVFPLAIWLQMKVSSAVKCCA